MIHKTICTWTPRRFAWAWAIITVATTAVTSTSQAGDRLQTPPELASLHDRWEGAMREFHLAGMAVAVVRGDEVILLDTFGIRNPETNQPVTADTVFYIASSTKSFIAMAIAILVDDGRIKLDDPVRKYLPRFETADPDFTAKLTTRDLLCHRYGLDSMPISFGEAFSGEMNEDRFYRLLRTAKPRGRFGYTNLHFTIAGRIIQAISGKTWKAFLNERILQPAGMHRTYSSADDMYALADVALPVIEADGQWQVAATRKTDATMHAAGGLGASITDLTKWLKINMNGGTVNGHRIVSERLVREMQTQQTPAGTKFYLYNRDGYGLGWYIGRYKDKTFIHHFGGFTGYRAHVSFMPEHSLGVAVVVNQTSPAFNFSDLVACDVYDTLLNIEHKSDLLDSMRKGVRRDRKQMAQNSTQSTGKNPAVEGGLSQKTQAYVGTYTNPDWGNLRFSLKDGQLHCKLGQLNATLIATQTDHFRSEFESGLPSADSTFEFDADQHVSGVSMELAGMTLHFERH